MYLINIKSRVLSFMLQKLRWQYLELTRSLAASAVVVLVGAWGGQGFARMSRPVRVPSPPLAADTPPPGMAGGSAPRAR